MDIGLYEECPPPDTDQCERPYLTCEECNKLYPSDYDSCKKRKKTTPE